MADEGEHAAGPNRANRGNRDVLVHFPRLGRRYLEALHGVPVSLSQGRQSLVPVRSAWLNLEWCRLGVMRSAVLNRILHRNRPRVGREKVQTKTLSKLLHQRQL